MTRKHRRSKWTPPQQPPQQTTQSIAPPPIPAWRTKLRFLITSVSLLGNLYLGYIALYPNVFIVPNSEVSTSFAPSTVFKIFNKSPYYVHQVNAAIIIEEAKLSENGSMKDNTESFFVGTILADSYADIMGKVWRLQNKLLSARVRVDVIYKLPFLPFTFSSSQLFLAHINPDGKTIWLIPAHKTPR